MSFIFDDKKLLEELVKSALEFENKFTKKGQAAGDVTINPQLRSYLNLSKKLVDNLESTQFPKATDVSTQLETSDPLTVNNANSLGNLLEFLTKNQITVGGKRVAYAKNEKPDDNTYLPIKADMSSIVDQRDVDQQADYYVNKETISNYLVSLQILAKNNKNKILEVMVGKRVEDINKKFGINLSKNYQAPEQDVMTGVLATFPKTLDSSKIVEGNIPLTYKDISSDVSLRGWVLANEINVLKNQELLYPADKQNRFDWCMVINTLHSKAKALLQNFSTTPELKKRYQAFVNQVVTIASSFTGPDGKSCSIGSSTSSTQSGSHGEGAEAQTVGYDPNDPEGHTGRSNKGSSETQRQVSLIASLFPLQSDLINFNKIKTFAEAYGKLDSSAASDISDVLQKCNKMSSIYGRRGSQATSMSAADVQRNLPSLDALNPYLNDLMTLVNKTGDILTMFNANFGHHFSKDVKDKYMDQMGSSSSDASSFYSENVGVIREWQNAARNLDRH